MQEVIDRCPTGISGFDSLCSGGFVRNSSNVIIGGAGTGKTTFLLQFLWNGVNKYNENGLYCSFEPDISGILEDARGFGWDFYKLNQENKVHFLKFSPKTDIDDLKKEISSLVSRFDIKRICFDPISVLAMNMKENEVRDNIFGLVSILKKQRVTSLIADESMEMANFPENLTSWSKADVVRFLADSVVNFYEVGIQGKSDRALKIMKMRQTNHFRGYAGMNILDSGVEVVSG